MHNVSCDLKFMNKKWLESELERLSYATEKSEVSAVYLFYLLL